MSVTRTHWRGVESDWGVTNGQPRMVTQAAPRTKPRFPRRNLVHFGFFLSPKMAVVLLGGVGERVDPQGPSGVFGKGFYTEEESLEAGCLDEDVLVIKLSELGISDSWIL